MDFTVYWFHKCHLVMSGPGTATRRKIPRSSTGPSVRCAGPGGAISPSSSFTLRCAHSQHRFGSSRRSCFVGKDNISESNIENPLLRSGPAGRRTRLGSGAGCVPPVHAVSLLGPDLVFFSQVRRGTALFCSCQSLRSGCGRGCVCPSTSSFSSCFFHYVLYGCRFLKFSPQSD